MFKQWGWDAHIERFEVLYPTPISTTVELVAPQRITLGGQEPAIAEDPSTADLSKALPPYVAFQGDGDVTAPVVYVNYGMHFPLIILLMRTAATSTLSYVLSLP